MLKLNTSIYKTITATLLITIQILTLSCAPIKKKKIQIKQPQTVSGIISILQNEKINMRKLVVTNNEFKSDAAVVIGTQEKGEPLKFTVHIQITGLGSIKESITTLGEPSRYALLREGKLWKELRLDWIQKENSANEFKGVFLVDESFSDLILSQNKSLLLEISFTHSKVVVELRTPPSGFEVESIEVPFNSATKVHLSSGSEAVMVRRFEVKNNTSLPLRLSSQHFSRGNLYRSFGAYDAKQFDVCSGGTLYRRHHTIISERLILVPSTYTQELFEKLDESLESPLFEVEIMPGKKKHLFLFAIVQPLYHLENMGECWRDNAYLVRSCHEVCVLRMPLSHRCVQTRMVPNPQEEVTITRSIEGHGVEIADLFHSATLKYADIPNQYEQIATLVAPSSYQVTVNGSIAFDSPIDAAYAECKL